MGGGALYNPDPNFSPSVAFPRPTPKSFFILIGLCPLLKTATNVSVLYMLHNGAVPFYFQRRDSFIAPLTYSPLEPLLALELHGASLVLFSVNLAPLTFSSLESLLALETAWRPSRPFLRQFGSLDVFFPGAPACT